MLHKVVGVEEVRYQSPSYILGPGPEEIRLCVADGWRAARQAICQSKLKPCQHARTWLIVVRRTTRTAAGAQSSSKVTCNL
jgi:hypothetical protein